MPGPWDGHCLGVRDRLRCANMGSRSSVLVCEFHAPGEGSEFFVHLSIGCTDGCPPSESSTLFWALRP